MEQTAKKVVILEGSPRKGGNTDLLSDEFARGTREAGHQVEKFYLAQRDIHPCLGCNSCRRTPEHTCVFKERDDFEPVIQAVIASDVLVMASPVYFYSWTAQTKAAIDRFYAREDEVRDKAAYFVTASAAPVEEYVETAKASFRGFISCFENVREGGMVCGLGCSEKGDALESPAMREAYELGLHI